MRQFKTSVEPLSGENFAGSCSFELSLPAPEKRIRAVWLTYDRGYDISRYYADPEVVAFAEKHAIVLLLAHQCPAKEPPTQERGEMNMDPSRERRLLDTFDWYSPVYQSKHTYEEVFRWFEDSGLEDLHVLYRPIAVRGTKPLTNQGRAT